MDQHDVNSRERKRARFEQPAGSSASTRPLVIGAVVVALAVAAVAFLGARSDDGATPAAAPATTTRSAVAGGTSAATAAPLAPEAGAYRIPVAGITSEAAFYKAEVGQTAVPFFAVRDAAGQPVVALDACQVCAHARKGYRQSGAAMQCVNCGMTFPIDKIAAMGGKGGCHPITLPARVEGGDLVVDHGDVASGARWF